MEQHSQPRECRFFRQGHCRNGTSCPFKHSTSAQQFQNQQNQQSQQGQQQQNQQTESHAEGQSNQSSHGVCKFWLSGYCRHGNSCSFSHQGPQRNLQDQGEGRGDSGGFRGRGSWGRGRGRAWAGPFRGGFGPGVGGVAPVGVGGVGVGVGGVGVGVGGVGVVGRGRPVGRPMGGRILMGPAPRGRSLMRGFYSGLVRGRGSPAMGMAYLPGRPRPNWPMDGGMPHGGMGDGITTTVLPNPYSPYGLVRGTRGRGMGFRGMGMGLGMNQFYFRGGRGRGVGIRGRGRGRGAMAPKRSHENEAHPNENGDLKDQTKSEATGDHAEGGNGDENGAGPGGPDGIGSS